MRRLPPVRARSPSCTRRTKRRSRGPRARGAARARPPRSDSRAKLGVAARSAPTSCGVLTSCGRCCQVRPDGASASGLSAWRQTGPAEEPRTERGDSGRPPVPGGLGAQPSTRTGSALVPERSQAVVTSLGAESGERRSSGGAVLRGVDACAGQILEHPADSGAAAVDPDVQGEPGSPGNSSRRRR